MPDLEKEETYLERTGPESEEFGQLFIGERALAAPEVFLSCEVPERIKEEARDMALAALEGLFDREDRQPNEWRINDQLDTIDKRRQMLAKGPRLARDLQKRTNIDPKSIVAVGAMPESRQDEYDLRMMFRSMSEKAQKALGYNLEELRMAGVHLEHQERVELIKALDQAKGELNAFLHEHQVIAQILSVAADKDAEVGIFGHPREVRVQLKALATIGQMGPSFEGEEAFGDKFTKALVARMKVAKGEAPWPRVDAQPPSWGGRVGMLGFMLREVAGEEKTRHLWENSPHRQFREPARYVLEQSLPQALDSLGLGVITSDLTADEIEFQKKEYLNKDWGGIPDLTTFAAEVAADESLADSLRACIAAHYFFRISRLDVENCAQPTGRRVKKGSLLNTYLEVPEGAWEWGAENSTNAGDKMILYHLITRLTAEGFKKRPRWMGSETLVAVLPNLGLGMTHFIFFTRESETGERQDVSLHEAIFEKGLLLRQLPLDRVWLEDQETALFEKHFGKADQNGVLRDNWRRWTSTREDISTLERLTAFYGLNLFLSNILKPEKGYPAVLAWMKSKRQQRENAKQAEVGVLLNWVGSGLGGKEAEAGTDLTMANCMGAVLFECTPPRKAIADANRYTRETAMRYPLSPEIEGVGVGVPLSDLKFAGEILGVIDAAMLAGVFPQVDWGDNPQEKKESTRKAGLCALWVAFVALEGEGLLPGDVWEDIFPGKENKDFRERSLGRIKKSRLYDPYKVITRERVKAKYKKFKQAFLTGEGVCKHLRGEFKKRRLLGWA